MTKNIEVSFAQILDWVRNADSYKTAREIMKQGGFSEAKTNELLAIIDKQATERGIDLVTEEAQAEYRKQIGETGRSVPQFSDPAV